ncbi:ankyrin repeat, PH and SEC7 domain containing protein secG-like [Limulus polyphemus]|uniref:Alpha-latrotoxin n=1 Tax=Limulus polyphemus TaxID=6850 RepID=A0ABM1BXV9_LIMPO|nr:ankyrin repeat, PH and SEC7 domain containing protein secG-like [Limulus polyphemus]
MKDSCTQTENESLKLSSGNTPNPETSLLESPVTGRNSYSSHSSVRKPKLIFHPEHLLNEDSVCSQTASLTSDDSDHETTSSSDVQERELYGEELIRMTKSSNVYRTYAGKKLLNKKIKADPLRKTGNSQAESETVGESQKVAYKESNGVGSEESVRTRVLDDTSGQNVKISEHDKLDKNRLINVNDALKNSPIPSIQTQKEVLKHEGPCLNIKETVLHKFNVSSDEILKQLSAPNERTSWQTSDDFAGSYSSGSTETSGECTTASSETSGECTTISSETSGECTTTSSNCESFTEEDSYPNIIRTDKEELLSEETSSECDSCCSCCQVTDEEEDPNEVLSYEDVVAHQGNDTNDADVPSHHHQPESEAKNETRVATSGFVMKSTPAYLIPPTTEECDIMHTGKPIPDELENANPEAGDLYRQLSEEEFVSTLKIHEAAKSGDLHVIKLLLKSDRKRTETVDERGWTPIHLAAAHGHVDIVKFLALEGADLVALDPSGYTAIHLAAMNGHTSCVEVLLSLGCKVENVTSEGFTPLHLAVLNAHVDCSNLLLSVGADISRRDALNRTVHDMAEEYSLDEISELLVNYCKKLHRLHNIL